LRAESLQPKSVRKKGRERLASLVILPGRFLLGAFSFFLLAILSFKKDWQYCHLKKIGNIVI